MLTTPAGVSVLLADERVGHASSSGWGSQAWHGMVWHGMAWQKSVKVHQ